MNEFPKILKELRLERGLTQVQLSAALGFKALSVVANWEAGYRTPDIHNLKLLSKFFNVSIDYLVGNEG